MTGSLIIFALIVLAYFYTSSHPIEKVRLKQSQGWVTFVLLGKNSIQLLLDTIFHLLVLWIFLYCCAVILSIPYYFGASTPHFTDLLSKSTIAASREREFFFFFFVFLFALIRAKALMDAFTKKDEEEQLATLRSAIDDGKIRIIIDALTTQTPVRISLKSRKVYIGIIVSEHFEPSDLDNIIVIPYFSGYREKDTLKLILDTNYADIYIKNGLVSWAENENSQAEAADNAEKIGLHHFRCVISSAEIESISLFKLEYFYQFSTDNSIP